MIIVILAIAGGFWDIALRDDPCSTQVKTTRSETSLDRSLTAWTPSDEVAPAIYSSM